MRGEIRNKDEPCSPDDWDLSMFSRWNEHGGWFFCKLHGARHWQLLPENAATRPPEDQGPIK